jgi:DNA-binding MarR family transcriptional regulator
MPISDLGATSDVFTRMAMLWRELRRGASTTVVRDRMFGTGDAAVEPGHMDVLDLLHEHEPRRMNDLAAALRVDPSTVTRAIQRMEADGLVQREPASEDGRGIAVRATEEGRQRRADVAQRRHDIVGHVMEPLSEEDRQHLVELLHRFVLSLDDYVRSGAPVVPAPGLPAQGLNGPDR